MHRSRGWIAAAVLGAAALVIAGCSSETRVSVDQEQQTGIAVSGTGRVAVVPDVALVNLGVEVTRSTVAEARSAAATAMDSVRASLKRNNIDDKDIATQYFSIQPQYGTSDTFDRGTPRITGYSVVNQLSVKVRRIDDVSKVVDAAVTAGGDAARVQGVTFTVDKPEQFQSQAREQAVADARARAEQLAKLAGVKLGSARAVSETSGGIPTDFAKLAVPATGSGETSFSPGQTEITLSVSVVYDIE